MDANEWNQINKEDIGPKIKSLPLKQITSVVMALEDKQRLEALGRALSVEQCLELFANLPNAIKKLNSIIVGLPHQNFKEVLLKGSKDQLLALKQQGINEPIEHQITIYLHEIDKRVQTLSKQYENFHVTIETISPETLDPENFQQIWQNLCKLSEDYLELMREISVLLLLAWNTDRDDLIEKLTHLKELCHRTSRFGVGFPETAKEAATGLFKLLSTQLFSVYGAIDDIKSAYDNEPAIEGLTKFSNWYLQDYWELGLLPQIKNSSELNKEQADPKKQQLWRDHLFQEVQKNLASLGLKTVKDLKNRWIYSTKSLTAYIQKTKSNLYSQP